MPQKPKYSLKTLNPNSRNIGQRIKEARKKIGLTQTQLAEKIGITQYLVSDYETNRIKITAEMLSHFAVAIGTSADKLLGLDVKHKEKQELSLRFTRRLAELSTLPPKKVKPILKLLDDLIRVNK